MRKIQIFDTTLRDGEQSPGCSMNLTEKLEMARQLDALGVSVIEAGFAIASPDDFKAVQAIARTVKNCRVASLSRALKGDIDRAWEAVQDAVHPVIHTFLATSDIHMKYKLKKEPEEVIAQIDEMVRYAKSLCPDVEFSAEDASRSDRAFLARAISTAIRAGANVVNIPDTVGYATPEEMYGLIDYLKKNVPGIDDVVISVHCHNDLGLATANTLAAIRAGATQAECTVSGIGERAGNASLEEIVMNLKTRRDVYDADCDVNTKQIYRSCKLLSSITGVPIAPNKAIVGENAFAHESGIHQHGVLANKATYEIMSPESIGIPEKAMVLGKHSGKHAFVDRIRSLGHDIPDSEVETAFERFKELADKKKTITDRDIEALISSQKALVVPVYSLKSFVINTGTQISATATVKLERDGESIEKVAGGAGPIDAAFHAIDKITKTGATLDNYTIQSVTDGEDALGEVVVRLSHDGRQITGRGLSTDILEASIKAYINGVNKIATAE
ncbi:2-isopropylmalate synthase [Feifania hominis]|uniref:2-isopropylmalate synthase n=1 Tax=Feifania hominis TaxID=2763660 RepID=A0A926DD78_9FIRM|nr:2-isopropylmalate synthase [Feifania hominis]MBC8535691.1 2-isopropylmalate synthase [Feifania hominis]